jgi:hypothetical protein
MDAFLSRGTSTTLDGGGGQVVGVARRPVTIAS